MRHKSAVKWSIKELTECLRERQKNKFDSNIGVSGKRGDGKSTFLFKIFQSFRKEGFRPHLHQVYSQDDVKNLLCNQKYGFCWDDEAINSGYKREFQKVGQIELIKVVTNYRDNFNIYGSALPFFYNLDKALRELIFMHVHIVSRGIGVILLPLEGQIHSQDPWDTRTNQAIEMKENARLERNPDAKFRFYKLTTFVGFVFFSPMTKKQEERYLKIKEKKRARLFEHLDKKNRPKTFMESLYDFLLRGELTKEGMAQSCLMNGKRYSTVLSTLNKMLKDNGNPKSLTDYIKKSAWNPSAKFNEQITELVPKVIS